MTGGKARPRRGLYFVAHHARATTDELVLEIARACAPPVAVWGAPFTDADHVRALAEVKRLDYWGGLGYFYPNPWRRGQEALDVPVQVGHNLRFPRSIETTGRRVFKPPLTEEERWCWFHLHGNHADLDSRNAADAEWFLDRARRVLPMLRPDFAFAAADADVATQWGEDPRRRAWPLLVLGPERAAAIGRERVLAAPAWRVDELPWGGVWVQAAENPFDAPAKSVRAVADHLGLERPD